MFIFSLTVSQHKHDSTRSFYVHICIHTYIATYLNSTVSTRLSSISDMEWIDIHLAHNSFVSRIKWQGRTEESSPSSLPAFNITLPKKSSKQFLVVAYKDFSRVHEIHIFRLVTDITLGSCVNYHLAIEVAIFPTLYTFIPIILVSQV